jgi:hypothetical protein
MLAIRDDSMSRKVFGIAFTVFFLAVFAANGFIALGEAANALTEAGFAVDLYVVLVVGLAKGVFLGLVAAVGLSCLRARRQFT